MHFHFIKSSWRSHIRIKKTRLSVFCVFEPASFHISSRTQQFRRGLMSNAKMDSSSITLNEAEETFRRLLLDVVEFIQKNPGSTSTTKPPASLTHDSLELRWTGGWVRDKLLKKDSHDIDVAINKMTGYEFGLRLKEYLDVPGNEKKYQVKGDKKNRHILSRISKIEANPDKSKHLETATTKILGLEIDLVNLRKETYSEDSRNPQMEFGTPEEDAMRRDATINAMFYNIQTSKVEDFTGRGFDDLRDGIIRTPLEPRTTFIDDPLRVLRLLRFASRFDYRIEEGTLQAMKEKDIKDALMLKISRERVLVEIEKMLKGPDPKMGLELIDTIGLYQCVFVEPTQPEFYTPDLTHWRDSYDTLSQLLVAKDSAPGSQLRSIVIEGKEEEYLSWILVAMVPYSNSPKIQAVKGKKMEHMVARVAREGLKLPSKIVDLLSLSNENVEQIKQFVLEKTEERDILGMAIRQWGPTWRLQVLFALLHEIYVNPGNKICKCMLFSE
jgi:tRNA nucleotidyltransferase (CCA-adding enzyme)